MGREAGGFGDKVEATFCFFFLFLLKIGSRSSVYSPESSVRKTGSYIYEEFMPTDGTDVKVMVATGIQEVINVWLGWGAGGARGSIWRGS